MKWSWLEIALYAFVAYLIFEALLRRAWPAYGMMWLAAKFAVVSVLYPWIYWKRPQVFRWTQLGWPLWAFLFTGLALTVAFFQEETLARAMGIAINLAFVPLYFIGFSFLSVGNRFRRFFGWLSFLAGVAGLVAIYQSTLPASHWMVVMTTGDEAIQIRRDLVRIPGTFQFPNTYGLFGVFGTSICCLSLLGARSVSGVVVHTVALACSLGGIFLSGSRAGGMGSLLVLACILITFLLWPGASRWRAKVLKSLGIAALGAVMLLPFVAESEFGEKIARMAEERTLVGLGNEEEVGNLSIAQRLEYYFLDRFGKAIELGKGIGVGWGIYTQGTLPFQKKPVNVELAEGGYARMIVENGILGIVLVLIFVYRKAKEVMEDRSIYQPWGVAMLATLILTHISLYMLQISVIAALWWLAFGAYQGRAGQARESRGERKLVQ